MEPEVLAQKLKEEIVGQDDAVEAVVRTVTVATLGVSDPKRPLGTFLFLGPTGVGKSQLPRSLAKILHEAEEKAIVVNATEFKNPHDVAKLVGAPPGYIGHEQSPFLTTEMLKEPMTVVVFEELEKADRALFDLLLQVLERAELKTGRGINLSFCNCFVFMTSNTGTWEVDKWRHGSIGFSPAPITPEEARNIKAAKIEEQNIYLRAAESYWSPEFLNRFDEIIVFKPLREEELFSILEKFLLEAQIRFAAVGIGTAVTLDAKKFLIAKGTNLRYGARPLRKAVRRYFEFPLASFGLKHPNSSNKLQEILVDAGKERLTFSVRKTLSANGSWFKP